MYDTYVISNTSNTSVIIIKKHLFNSLLQIKMLMNKMYRSRVGRPFAFVCYYVFAKCLYAYEPYALLFKYITPQVK